MSSEFDSITELLEDVRQGSAEAMNKLLPLIYEHLEQLAHLLRLKERPGHTLTTGDLVHEGLLRMLNNNAITQVVNRHQLYGAFSQTVRNLLIDHARRRQAAIHGGGLHRVALDDLMVDVRQRTRSDGLPDVEVLVLHEALTALAQEYARVAQVLEMRFFGAREMAEIAKAQGVSLRTVERDHRFGLAWLRDFLASEGTS